MNMKPAHRQFSAQGTAGNAIKRAAVCGATVVLAALFAGCHTTSQQPSRDARIVDEIKHRYEYRMKLIMRQDFDALEQFYPADHVVTNPSNEFINKTQVMEKLRAGLIRYSSYDRQFDYFRVYGDTVVVTGKETATVPPDSPLPNAGKTDERRFTEVWVRRDGTWQVVARHASNIVPAAAQTAR